MCYFYVNKLHHKTNKMKENTSRVYLLCSWVIVRGKEHKGAFVNSFHKIQQIFNILRRNQEKKFVRYLLWTSEI